MVTKSKLTYTFTFQLVIHVVQKCYDGEQETPWEQLQAFLHICLYALKAWNMFSCLFQTESVENFHLAFLGFSRFLQNQESLDTLVFPGIFPGFSARANKRPETQEFYSRIPQNPRLLQQQIRQKKKKKIINLNDAGSVFFLSQ